MVGCAVAAVSVAIAAPAVAMAQPSSADVGSSALDLGSSAVDLGSSVLDLGSSLLGIDNGGLAPGTTGPVQTQTCNASTKSGGAGVTNTIHQIGRPGPTSFVLAYETYDVPDRIRVYYEGAQILDTGYIGDAINEGTGSVVVSVPPGSATSVQVRIDGEPGTDWDYQVNCP